MMRSISVVLQQHEELDYTYERRLHLMWDAEVVSGGHEPVELTM